MHDHLIPHVDVSTSAAAVLSRRGSLLTLGGAVLASAAAGTKPVRAGKVAKKARKRSSKKCRRQIDQCRNVILDFCAGDDAECEEDTLNDILACCSQLATCQAGAALDCFFTAS